MAKKHRAEEQLRLNRQASRTLQKEGTGLHLTGYGYHGGDKRMVAREERQERKEELGELLIEALSPETLEGLDSPPPTC